MLLLIPLEKTSKKNSQWKLTDQKLCVNAHLRQQNCSWTQEWGDPLNQLAETLIRSMQSKRNPLDNFLCNGPVRSWSVVVSVLTFYLELNSRHKQYEHNTDHCLPGKSACTYLTDQQRDPCQMIYVVFSQRLSHYVFWHVLLLFVHQ